MTANDWHTEARCRPPVVDYFAPRPAAAKRQCAQCPCRDVCFWTAMVLEEEHAASDSSTRPMRWGVWGGTTPGKRATLAALYGPADGARMRLLRGRLDRAIFDHQHQETA